MKVYLDNNATTKLCKEAFEAMVPYLTEYYGNSHSMHRFGQETGKALREARETIANLLKIEADELIFTASGTEANNIGIRGVVRAFERRGKHIIVSEIEHPSVRNTAKDLEKLGYEVTFLKVDKNGLVDLEQLKKSIRKDTVLISVMHANNEVGTIQPLKEIGQIAKGHRILFHVDAVQTVGKLKFSPKDYNIDLMSFSAHKFYGPKGVGALYIKKGTRMAKFITGGGQEKGLRPGTSNVAAIVGMAKALEVAFKNIKEEYKKEKELRDYFEEKIIEKIPEIVINSKEVDRLPGTSSVTFKYLEGESILLSLDFKGIAVSSGSACSSEDLHASHVLLGMGIEEEFAHGTIRFSIGRYNTKEEIDYVINELPPIIERLRMMSPLWNEFKNN
ncbi:cysteine desulfurase [Hypnocyclicus thermotrophus]|uniref:cysteine desulfurase n=1 Tax=Hypnocyclicus thermotrophus TaxID=1627895 RepID=A0AA46DYR4_9FUSO|nr:cysteine desulfurase family protein [Hypnocyclicus thermotrophus]TDT70594.1 cysteine desulfurase [Hypnocyclicus thermotrophus]